MATLLRSLKHNRRLLKDFVIRDLKARYVGSSMGFFWSVIFPIINLFVYMFVFRLILKMRWGEHQTTGEVALIMLAGIVVWGCFAEGISRISNSVVENMNLIQKVVFPSEILPVYIAISCLINMIIAIPVVLAAVAYFAYISPEEIASLIREGVQVASMGPGLQDVIEPPPNRPVGIGLSLVCLPILFLLQTMFTVGLGYILATLNVFWRDTVHLVGVFITVWMFTTPIFYPAIMVESKGYGFILDFNPMYWLIEEYRNILVYGDWPNWVFVGKLALVSFVILFLGSRMFLKNKHRFPDLL